MKTRRRCAPPFSCYPRKTAGGGVQTPPPQQGEGNGGWVGLPRVATGRFQLSPISPDDLCRVIARMRNSAACGSDGLCIRFVKICLPSICHVITHIVNSSIASHHVPDSWKLTLVHPIQKSPKSTDTANYRPISILPTIAKIIERVVYEQLSHYFTTHHLFTPCQHGFRVHHSTDTALLSVTDCFLCHGP